MHNERRAGNMCGVPDDGFATPEEAAMAEWASYPTVDARVVTVEYIDDDHAVVVTDTMPSHPMWNYCERTASGWTFTHDHN
jgi:hypothetical protein